MIRRAGRGVGVTLVGVRPSVRRAKVLVFIGIGVTLQMFHPPTRIRGRL